MLHLVGHILEYVSSVFVVSGLIFFLSLDVIVWMVDSVQGTCVTPGRCKCALQTAVYVGIIKRVKVL
jgi:hypothetical protein